MRSCLFVSGRGRIAVLWLVTSALLSPVAATATSLRAVSIGDLLGAAELVFEGRVLSRESGRRARGSIRTCARFEVLDVLKGPPVASPLELCFSGGAVDGRMHGVHGMIHPKRGERGVYFVESLSQPMVNPLYGWQQGHFVVSKDGSMRSADGRALLGLDPADELATGLSNGVARGARVAPRGARGAPGMGVDAFKAELRARLGLGEGR